MRTHRRLRAGRGAQPVLHRAAEAYLGIQENSAGKTPRERIGDLRRQPHRLDRRTPGGAWREPSGARTCQVVTTWCGCSTGTKSIGSCCPSSPDCTVWSSRAGFRPVISTRARPASGDDSLSAPAEVPRPGQRRRVRHLPASVVSDPAARQSGTGGRRAAPHREIVNRDVKQVGHSANGDDVSSVQSQGHHFMKGPGNCGGGKLFGMAWPLLRSAVSGTACAVARDNPPSATSRHFRAEAVTCNSSAARFSRRISSSLEIAQRTALSARMWPSVKGPRQGPTQQAPFAATVECRRVATELADGVRRLHSVVPVTRAGCDTRVGCRNEDSLGPGRTYPGVVVSTQGVSPQRFFADVQRDVLLAQNTLHVADRVKRAERVA